METMLNLFKASASSPSAAAASNSTPASKQQQQDVSKELKEVMSAGRNLNQSSTPSTSTGQIFGVTQTTVPQPLPTFGASILTASGKTPGILNLNPTGTRGSPSPSKNQNQHKKMKGDSAGNGINSRMPQDRHVASDLELTLPNNSTVLVPVVQDKNTTVRINAPASGVSQLESTNNSFSKIQEVISYSWERQANVNMVAVHREKPLLAYVINTGYHKSFISGKRGGTPTNLDQVIRLINYDSSTRALAKPAMNGTIVDLAFAFNTQEESANPDSTSGKLAAVDNQLSIAIFYYGELVMHDSTTGQDKKQLMFDKILTIRSPGASLNIGAMIRLVWCPYVPSEDADVDASHRFAVCFGKSVEMYTLNKYHFKTLATDPVDRSIFKKELGEYFLLKDLHESDIVNVALAPDGTAICTASTDNTVKFTQIKDGTELVHIRTWKPSLGHLEEISHFCFLDNYDYLLSNPDLSFWGYIFVASKTGSIRIHDLKSNDWGCVQSLYLKIDQENVSDLKEDFTYTCEPSSNVILASRGQQVFVILLELNITKTDDGDEYYVPRIKQVARFSLYVPVISFQVKRSCEKEIEVFWITLKALQRCTISREKLDELKNLNPIMITPKFKQEKKRISTSAAAPIPNSILPPTVSSVVVSDGPSVATPTGTIQVTPNAHLDSLFKTVKNSNLNHAPATDPKEEELMHKLQSSSQQLEKLRRKSEIRPDGTPVTTVTPVSSVSSAGILDKLDKLKIGSNNQQMVASGVAVASSPGVPVFTGPSAAMIPPALNDTARAMLIDNKFRELESKFDSQFMGLKSTLSTAFTALQNEIGTLRAEVSGNGTKVDRNVIQVTVDKVVEKSMDQLGKVISAGLKDFFEQVDVSISELQTTVAKNSQEMQESYRETNGYVESLRTQMEIYQKQLEKNEAEQQLLLYKLSQFLNAQQSLQSPMTPVQAVPHAASSASGSTHVNLGSLFLR